MQKERYEYFFGTNTIKDNKTNQFYGCVVDLLNQQDKENEQLKHQLADLEAKLAEKDTELEKWSTQYARAYVVRQNDLIAEKVGLQQQLAEKEQENERLMDKNSQLKKQLEQDKISFAVEQLEKVKEYTDDVWWVDGVSEVVCNFIDNQIKQLKEMN